MRPTGAAEHEPKRRAATSLTRRLLWFVGLWLAGVGAVGTVAYAIRLWLL